MPAMDFDDRPALVAEMAAAMAEAPRAEALMAEPFMLEAFVVEAFMVEAVMKVRPVKKNGPAPMKYGYAP
jgi:hypothetical protein